MPQHELSLHVVGLDFENTDKAKSNRRFEMALCVPGERVDLVPEPKHPKDSNAVAVFTDRGRQPDYLTAERAPWISRKIAAGEPHEPIFQGASNAAIVRVKFGEGEPTLTLKMEATALRPTSKPNPERNFCRKQSDTA